MDNQQPQNPVGPPPVSPIQDPEAKKEADEIKVKMARLEYYKELAKVVAVWLQMFKAEAVSLVSGVGTLLLGWFQIRKWVIQGRAEIKTMKAEVSPKKMEKTSSKVGGGSGHFHHATKTSHKVVPKAETPAKSSSESLVGTVGIPSIPTPAGMPTMGADTWAFFGVAGIFVTTMVHFVWKSFKGKLDSRPKTGG